MIKINRKKSLFEKNKKQLHKILWKYFSKFIVNRDKKICFTCGNQGNQSGHLITRSKMSIRYNELNNHCQCSGCNYLHEFQPEIYTQKFIQKYGLNAYNKLVYLGNTILKYSKSELITLINYYKNKE